MQKAKKIVSVIAVLAVLYFVLVYATGITGTVVDAETGKPIGGANVLVEWTMTHGIGLTHTSSYKVKEKITDRDGQFKVCAVLNPFVNEPNITIYKKGYVAWSNRWIFPGDRNRAEFHWGNQIFKLEQFKEVYSYIDHTGFIRSSINSSINFEAKRKIYNAFSWEDQMASKERDRKAKRQ